MSFSSPVPTWKRFDTYPPFVAALTSAGSFVDLTAATAIKTILKGATAEVTGTCSKLTVVTPTASVVLGQDYVTVSSLASIVVGSSVQGLLSGIPPGTRVGSIDVTDKFVYLVDANNDPVLATKTAAAATLTFNVGTVTYSWATNDLSVADTYENEVEVTWSGGAIETFPNDGYNEILVLADLEDA